MSDDKFTGALGTSFGTFYPEGYIVAAFEDRGSAERAASALQGAGRAGHEVRLFSGEETLANHEEFMGQRNLGQRVAGLLASEEQLASDEYLDLARQGHYFLIVHAPDQVEIDRASPLLKEHGAHHIRHYGKLTISSLDERS